jgi:hypothetical protein
LIDGVNHVNDSTWLGAELRAGIFKSHQGSREFSGCVLVFAGGPDGQCPAGGVQSLFFNDQSLRRGVDRDGSGAVVDLRSMFE